MIHLIVKPGIIRSFKVIQIYHIKKTKEPALIGKHKNFSLSE